ncbi:MAG: hypothetical protein WCO63_09805 [Bacteroidota bacterium]
MKQALKSLLSRYIVFTVIVAVLAFGISMFLPMRMRTPALPFLIPFFLILGVGIHSSLLKMKEERFARFVNAYLVASFLKLFVYLIVLMVYDYINRKDAIPFSITFLVLYIAYSVFEVITFLNGNKKRLM